MKKNKIIKLVICIFIIFLGLLILIQNIFAKEYVWQDFNKACFKKSADFVVEDDSTLIVNVKNSDYILFEQENGLLNFKKYGQSRRKSIDYEIIDYSGVIKNGDNYNFEYLKDEDKSTFIRINPYSNLEKFLLIDLKKELKKNDFYFNLNYDGKLKPHYYISKDNKKFIEIGENLEKYSFRYLKIVFKNAINTDYRKYNATIYGLAFYEEGPIDYLVKANRQGNLKIYSEYNCKDKEVFNRFLTDFKFKSLINSSFSINSDTKTYKIELKDNSIYNNDFDDDGIINDNDNCPYDKNENQSDIDQDLVGDICDFDNRVKNSNEKDYDKDGVGDLMDNCKYIYNPRQQDSNANKKGDLCSDDDHDGIIGNKDNCINVYNPRQEDLNVNNIGDACEFDFDNDGIFDSIDNCKNIYNPNQEDTDKDEIGNKCDNCDKYNPQQIDKNYNKIGDVCEVLEKFEQKNDQDKDGVLDFVDNCKLKFNKDQKDKDNDGVGDVCDNCIDIQNKKQIDKDKNQIGDMCEDVDNDGIVGYLDNCIDIKNANQIDQDNDGVGDLCEDDDNDGILAFYDNCPFSYNKDQLDVDNDGIGDKCDKKDDRFIESNRNFFIGFILLTVTVFVVLIFLMMQKLSKEKF